MFNGSPGGFVRVTCRKVMGGDVKIKGVIATTCGLILVVAACSNTSDPVNELPPALTTLATSLSPGQSGADTADDDPGTSGEPFAPLDLGVGTCFDDPPAEVEMVTPEDVPALDCEFPHDNEVIGNFNVGGEGFPGTDTVQTQADGLCRSAFEEYIGSEYETSAYDFSWYFPTAESWEVGGTNIICFAYNADLSTITGSVAGTGS